MDIIEKINGPRYFVDDCTISGVANGIVSTIEGSYYYFRSLKRRMQWCCILPDKFEVMAGSLDYLLRYNNYNILP